MQGKLNKLIPVGVTASGAQEIVIDVTVNEKCAIQVNYAAGSAGDLSLEASNDGENYAEMSDSVQAMDAGGGSHMWNVDNMFFKFLRIQIPAGAVTASVLFGGNTPIVRS